MDDKDKVIKHLEMIQTIINRLGNNSFLIKGWSITLVVASLVLMSEVGTESPLIILFLVPLVLAFWALDGYFLWQERLFREIYNEVRLKEDTDFEMKLKGEPECNWPSSMFSKTLCICYIGEILFVIFILIFYICYSCGN